MNFDHDFEARLLRFEQDRQRLGPLDIVTYLGRPSELDEPERSRLLAELVCIDLEFAWKDPDSGSSPTLEQYLGLFSEPRSLDTLPIELIVEEYRVRQVWGDRPTHSVFLSRFLERIEPLRQELVRIDAEIEAEADRPIRSNSSRRIVNAGSQHDRPLLSSDGFLIRRMIGQGRMGKVYEARASYQQNRPVAIKFLRRSYVHNSELVERFLQEARTIASLCHPNVVGTEGLGRTIGGSYFIVMELVNGPDLSRILAERTVGVDEALGWVRQACLALEHAHENGIIHCDLKPANLLLDESGRIRVTDFGLARSISPETRWAIQVEGTAPFMAPEQADPCWGSIDARTDVYGIGAVLYNLLTGQPPFPGRRLADVLAQVVSATPVQSAASLRPGLPHSIDQLCGICLEKRKVDRYPTIRELRLAIEANLEPGRFF